MENKENILLFGCGVTARAAYAYFKNCSQYNIEAFVVDKQHFDNSITLDIPIWPYEHINKGFLSTHKFVVCVGYQSLNRLREKIYSRLTSDGWKFTSLVCESYLTLGIEHGENCIIMPGGILQPNCVVGSGTIIWPGAVIGHDTVVGDFCWLTSGCAIGGNASVGNFTFVGMNAVVNDNVQVGIANLIGSSSCISKNTSDGKVFIAQSLDPIRIGSEKFVQFSKFGE